MCDDMSHYHTGTTRARRLNMVIRLGFHEPEASGTERFPHAIRAEDGSARARSQAAQ